MFVYTGTLIRRFVEYRLSRIDSSKQRLIRICKQFKFRLISCDVYISYVYIQNVDT